MSRVDLIDVVAAAIWAAVIALLIRDIHLLRKK